MTTLANPDKTIARTSPRRGAAGWLGFAAAPTFALMAWIAAETAAPAALCSSSPDMRSIGGMTAMYLLMSLFHLSPWLKLAAGATDHSTTRGDRR